MHNDNFHESLYYNDAKEYYTDEYKNSEYLTPKAERLVIHAEIKNPFIDSLKNQDESVVDLNVDQGDVFHSVPFFELYTEIEYNNIEVKLVKFPYAIVMTQACDLKQYKNDLVSVLVIPVYNLEDFIICKHTENLGYITKDSFTKSTEKKSNSKYELLINNKNPRYHYFYFEDSKLPVEMVADFKHYFSVSIQHLRKNANNKLYTLRSLYREHLSQRFAFYLSRIGLPDKTEFIK